ncbi:hypothetical protein ACIA49_06535 [Kribbella sp. NPDC051587]|uniref:hypothetical protein n=1 Tax=Kribbella sp. NPDC051587 TaxID=3364119 RepID=UPI0037BD82F9
MSLEGRAHALQTEAHELFTTLDLGTAFPWPPVLGHADRVGGANDEERRVILRLKEALAGSDSSAIYNAVLDL